MIESIKSLLEGVTLIELVEGDTKTIVELSFYDKEQGIDSDYPCINTCISDNNGEEWVTRIFFTWTDFINKIKEYLSYYETRTPYADYLYIKEGDFL